MVAFGIWDIVLWIGAIPVLYILAKSKKPAQLKTNVEN